MGNILRKNKTFVPSKKQRRRSSTHNNNSKPITKIPTILEADNITPVEVETTQKALKNWGENIPIRPACVFHPKTKVGICNVIKWASRKQLRVRACGYCHTWNNVYSNDGQVLIQLLGSKHVASLNSPREDKWKTGAGAELRTIQYIKGSEDSDNHIYCRVGGAVTNDELRQFCLDNSDQFSNQKWSLPLNVILVENTIAGTVSSICHGSGATTKTISDLVVELEFVNAHGNLQIVNGQLLRTAAGSFGLLGVITSITLKLDKASYAFMHPYSVNILKAIPPPSGFLIASLPKQLQHLVDSQAHLDFLIDRQTRVFHDQCQNDYYAEWFWFILQDKCWINVWSKADEGRYDANQAYWSTLGYQVHKRLEEKAVSAMHAVIDQLNQTASVPMPVELQEHHVKIQNSLFMANLQLNLPRLIPTSEALHFQRAIRHMRCRDCEIEIPIPVVAGKPDWSICQRAWWDAIAIIYAQFEHDRSVPINLALEMRVMSGSGILMAPQYGNEYTCCIEVLATLGTPVHEWRPIVEQIIQKWISYTDTQTGLPLNVRTHWAKEWDSFKFGDLSAKDFVRETHKHQLSQFKLDLNEIAMQGGYSLNEMKERFSNDLWDDVIFRDDAKPAIKIIQRI